jgi:hypothetical protein
MSQQQDPKRDYSIQETASPTRAKIQEQCTEGIICPHISLLKHDFNIKIVTLLINST